MERLIRSIITPRMKRLSFKNYPTFVIELRDLSEKAIREFGKFLQEVQYDKNLLEKKARRGF